MEWRRKSPDPEARERTALHSQRKVALSTMWPLAHSGQQLISFEVSSLIRLLPFSLCPLPQLRHLGRMHQTRQNQLAVVSLSPFLFFCSCCRPLPLPPSHLCLPPPCPPQTSPRLPPSPPPLPSFSPTWPVSLSAPPLSATPSSAVSTTSTPPSARHRIDRTIASWVSVLSVRSARSISRPFVSAWTCSIQNAPRRKAGTIVPIASRAFQEWAPGRCRRRTPRRLGACTGTDPAEHAAERATTSVLCDAPPMPRPPHPS
mmetsp:Transcript_9506/g.20602  ORF Transcript_9506/g.20602 Transcript_9506/m.20602 type:complete len:259 (+) Transcript_9506:312-1088(+)